MLALVEVGHAKISRGSWSWAELSSLPLGRGELCSSALSRVKSAECNQKLMVYVCICSLFRCQLTTLLLLCDPQTRP